jgi:hypothetical protein
MRPPLSVKAKKKPKKMFRVVVPGRPAGYFEGHTKSEARAEAKRALGYRDRLPVGTMAEVIEG